MFAVSTVINHNQFIMHSGLQHAINLTRQTDTDSLDCCLAQLCESYFSNFQLTIYKIARSNHPGGQTLYQQFKHMKDHDNDFCFHWNQDVLIENNTGDKAFQKCINSNQPVIQDNLKQQQLLIPYSYKHNNHGVIEITHSPGDNSKEESFIQLTQIYENVYNILNDNERDQLTGLFNRKTFDKKLSKLLNLQSKKQQQYSSDQNRAQTNCTYSWLVAIDIDHFKLVNDQFGHLYGDEVLLHLSQLMQKTFRSMDLIFRFGGEEFILILEPTTLDMAFKTLERFRKIVSGYDFPLVGNITISIGFARITTKDYPTHILDCADKTLYYAKEHGRNCTYNFEELVEQNKLQISETASSNDIDLF